MALCEVQEPLVGEPANAFVVQDVQRKLRDGIAGRQPRLPELPDLALPCELPLLRGQLRLLSPGDLFVQFLVERTGESPSDGVADGRRASGRVR